jgi:GTP pyrophosphokinase
MKVARSGKARSKIKSWLRQAEKTEREEKIDRGRDLLMREILRRDKGRDEDRSLSGSTLNKIASDLGYGHGDDLLASVGGGGQSPSAIASRFLEIETSQAQPAQIEVEETCVPAPEPKRESDSEIIVEGSKGVMVSLANCCKPVPGDEIVGYVTKTRGITIHRTDCPNVAENLEERRIEVSWGDRRSVCYQARLKLEGADRPGLFADVAQAISSFEGSITQVRAFVAGGDRGRMIIDLHVRDLEHLYRIIAKLNSIKGVIEVIRG